MDTDSDENKDFFELVDEYKDQEKMWHFEGNSGLDKLNKLCGAIGYESHGFKYGSNLEVFLADNPGACEAILEWIADAGNSAENWKEELLSNLNEKEDSEEDSDEDLEDED